MTEPEWGVDVCALALGCSERAAAAAVVEAWLRDHVGAVHDVSFLASNMVAVFRADTTLHRRVVVRVYQPGTDVEAIERSIAAQHAVLAAGIPAPRPIAGPLPIGLGIAVVEQFLSVGANAETGWGEDIGRPMGAGLARVVDACRTLDGNFPCSTGRTEDSKLVSHTSLFDFERTQEGAEWIEEFATRANAVLWSFPPDGGVVAFSDWRLGNVEVAGGVIRAVYDWSSLERTPEAEALGAAAIGFGAWWDRDGRKAGTPGEAAVFVAAYEDESGRRMTPVQRRIAGASATLHLAFVARCEHSLGWPDGPGLSRDALRNHGDELLEKGIG